ncbi:MAG: BaiN/RdsA family NAD(P)/FAD-dependent oxidoreductase [Minisyncoccota bacterium]
MRIDPKLVWDVAVIGGGPAGMMAAGRAAERGAKVIIIEKNPSLGRKLLITGGGRCNVTNAEPDTRKFLAKFKDSDQFLFSAFSQWGVKEALDFFNTREMVTKVEAEQRVFPVSNSAKSVWDVLVNYIEQNKVTIVSDSPVKEIIVEDGKVIGVKLKDKSEILASSVILATGGISHPETGSTGDGFKWLEALGHKVTKPTAALVPIAVKDEWVKNVAGLAFSNIKINVLQNDVKQEEARGKVLFTHVGLSGPAILNLSSSIGELLKYGEVVISLDILPELDYAELNKKLQEIFKEQDKRKFKNCLSTIVPPSLAPVIVSLSKIDPDKQCNAITREERLALVKLLKHLTLTVDSLLGEDKAVTTSGGVALDEIDFKTMRSRLYSNLFIVGDVLNIDRPSGGYSLQLCWTTGFVAGNSVLIRD